VKRNYRLPDDVDPATVRSHLTMNGILRITADKKNKKGGR
jgi:HSP20 family molecular chaperone IbpA